MPNKFLIETALDIGISNMEKSRNTDAKKLYDEVKEAQKTVTSPEEKSLYERFISLYEASVKSSSAASNSLKEEVKWKHLGDLREAVKNKGKGLSLADIEGINQFAGVEYSRQMRNTSEQDNSTLALIKEWTTLYPELKKNIPTSGALKPQESVDTTKEVLTLDNAIKKGFGALVSGKMLDPYTVEQNGKKYKFELSVDATGFTLGGKKFTINFPKEIKNGTFEFTQDEIIFSGKIDGGLRVKKLFTVSKSEVMEKVSGKTNEIVFQSPDDESLKITATGSGDYLPESNVINAPAAPNAQSPRQESQATGIEGLEKPLAYYAGYAEKELKKAGKSIKDLQEALKSKGHYKGEPNGTFDKATLEAVIAFQKTLKNPRYGADGLVGSEETIPALFGKIATPNTQAPGPRHTAPTSPSPSTVPPGTASPSTTPRRAVPGTGQPGAEINNEAELLTDLRTKAEAFRGVYTAVSKKTGTFFDTPEEIAEYKKAINEALLPLQKSLSQLDGKKLSKEGQELYDWAVLDVARYFSDGYSSIKNKHYRNYDLSVDLALSVIKNDLIKHKIDIPKKPSQTDVLKALAQHNPKLQKKIQEDLRAGFQLGQILANPRVRSEFDEVFNTVYKQYEKDLQSMITGLRDKNITFTNPSGYKALDMLIFTMGTTDTFALDSWKARNRDVLWQSAGMVGSTAAGILAFAATPATGGAGAIVGGAVLGGVVSTAGMILTKGRAGNDRETWTELGINTVTFGAGGALAKGASILMKNGTVLGKMSGIALDAAGGMALGVSADYTRAWEQDTNIALSETLRNNLAWALLPIMLGMKGALRTKAEGVDGKMQQARDQAAVGDTDGARQTLKNAEQQVAQVAEEAKKTVPKNESPTQSHETGQSSKPTDNSTQPKKQDNSANGTTENNQAPKKKSSQSDESGHATENAEPSPEPNSTAATKESLNHAPNTQPHVPTSQAHTEGEKAAKTVNQQIAEFTNKKAVKLAWDLATKEAPTGGLIKTTLLFPANIMRLPFINSRRILEQWFTKTDKGFVFKDGDLLDKVGSSLKIAATASEKPFEGKIQSMFTLATMGTVAWMTYEEIQRANPNAPIELTWGAAAKFLKNMNFTLPVAFYDWFTTRQKKQVAGAQVPTSPSGTIQAPSVSPPKEEPTSPPPSTVTPGEIKTETIAASE